MPLNVIVASQSKTCNRIENEGNLQRYAYQSRKADRFNDVFINAGDISFPAHRLVLGCYSPFFERLFESPMKEHYEGTVTLNHLDSEAVRSLIEYMYVGRITINQENVLYLLAAANYLQMNEICKHCFEFLKSAISNENWPTILSTLHLYENDLLLDDLYHFISENLSEISQSKYFKKLTIKGLVSIVQNLNRNIVKEMSKYNAIITWIRYDETNRKNKLSKLLCLVDLEKLPCDFLEDVVASDPLVKEKVEVTNTVMTVLAKQFKEMRLKESGSKIISIGGIHTNSKVFEVLNLFGKPGLVYPELPNPVYNCKVLKLNDYAYSIGGSSKANGNRATNGAYRINLKDAEIKWEEICPLKEERCHMGAEIIKDCLVVAGGITTKQSGTYAFNSKEEVYVLALNKWQRISKLNHSRMNNDLVECNGCLYALGGHHGNQVLSSVERLRDLDGKWENVEAMNCPRTLFAAVSCKGEIYAVGGRHRKHITLKTVEKYSPIDNKWIFVSAMRNERCFHAACVLNHKIFVVGGVDADDEPVRSIECYDPSNDKWVVAGEIEQVLVGHSLVVL